MDVFVSMQNNVSHDTFTLDTLRFLTTLCCFDIQEDELDFI